MMLAACGIPQAIQCIRQGHADGISAPFLWLWIGGELFTVAYIVADANWPLVVNYATNGAVVLVILKYKYIPR